MTKTKKELSARFREAYDTSYRAAVDDTSDDVVEARKQLRKLRPELKKKLSDVADICEAAAVVDHPIKERACDIASVVRSDYARLIKELARIRKPSKKPVKSKKTIKTPKSAVKKPMTYTKAAAVLKKHKIITSTKNLMKRGDATGGFLLSRL